MIKVQRAMAGCSDRVVLGFAHSSFSRHDNQPRTSHLQLNSQLLCQIEDTGAWFLGDLPWGQVLYGEGSYQQAVFTDRKGAPNSHNLAI